MIPPEDEDPSVDEAGDIAEKTAVINQGRQDRKVRQTERDIRKLAAAMLSFHSKGYIDAPLLESLIEMTRRR